MVFTVPAVLVGLVIMNPRCLSCHGAVVRPGQWFLEQWVPKSFDVALIV